MKLLWATYAKTRNGKRQKSWQQVSDRLRLPGKRHAWMMAHGKRPICAEMRLALRRAKPPRNLLRLIRKIAIPFLKNRQISPGGIYGRGGIPL